MRRTLNLKVKGTGKSGTQMKIWLKAFAEQSSIIGLNESDANNRS